MNLIADIAEMASKGMTAAKMAVELELKHGLQVSEAWLEHIMGADGFHAALAQARARLASVVDEPAKLVEEVIAKEDAALLKQADEARAEGFAAPEEVAKLVQSSATSAADLGVPVPAPAAKPADGESQ